MPAYTSAISRITRHCCHHDPPLAPVVGRGGAGRPHSDPSTRRRFADGCPRLPLAMFEEVHPPAPRCPGAPGAYLLLSEAYQDQATRAPELGWPVPEQASHHLALLTDPGLVAGSLHDVLGRLLPARLYQDDSVLPTMW